MFAGIITDAFSKLFGVIWDVIVWIATVIGKFFQTLINLFKLFLEIIFALIDGLLYFLYMVGVLAVKLFVLFFETGKILWSLIVGFGKTLSTLQYSPRGSSGHGYSEMLGKIFSAAEPLQLNVVAYILLFLIWVSTAVTAMKLVSSVRVGGD